MMTTFGEKARAHLNDNQPDPEPDDATNRHAGTRINWATFWDDDHGEDDWLLEPFIARARGHSLYALAKAGKSLWMLDVAARLATGRPILDRLGGHPIHVLYLDLEMTQDDVRERLLEMGYGPTIDMSHLHYYSLPSLAPLDTAIGGAEVFELAQLHAAELVIIDTLSRTVVGAENDADTLTAFFRYTGLPLKAAGIAVVRLDHAGKDLTKGMRGTSAKTNDVDVVWEMERRDDQRLELRATHKRMGWVPETIHLELREDPTRYEPVHDSWPAGTMECVLRIDELDLPTDMSSRAAQAALKAAGLGMKRQIIVAAVRFRRDRDNQLPTTESGS